MSESVTFPTVAIPVNAAWLQLYKKVNCRGTVVAPRGLPIREIQAATISVDMEYPLLTIPQRGINYKFAAAEAAWIISGRNDVEYLARYNPRMREFSDDGITLAGAYGPKLANQIGYVVDTLVSDRDTRRATMTIWRPNPETSRDIPCTVAFDFKIRGGYLNLHAFMRSSDVWLGVPYDVFSFSMFASFIASHYNRRVTRDQYVGLGTLYLTAASSHVYETHWDKINADSVDPMESLGGVIPNELSPRYACAWPSGIAGHLEAIADSKRGDAIRWWEKKND